MNDKTKKSGNADSGPVTVVIRRRIKLGFTKAYEQLEKEISADAATYEGYLGSTFLRPEGGADRDFVTIVRFASYKNVMEWEHSTTGSALINRADAMSELPATISRTAGLSLWFSPRHPASPRRCKMVLLLTISIFIVAQLTTPLLDPALRLLPTALCVVYFVDYTGCSAHLLCVAVAHRVTCKVALRGSKTRGITDLLAHLKKSLMAE